MGFRVRVAFVAALAALVAAASAQAAPTNGLAQRDWSRSTPARRSSTTRRANATPFVGAYGFGNQIGIGIKASPRRPGAVAGHRHRRRTRRQGRVGSPQQGVDYSGTNVQETGVDEPDMVKTNGNTLFTVSGNQLEAVDVTGHTPKLLDTLTLTNGGWSQQLLLSGTHLLVLSRGGYWIEPLPAMTARA